MCFKSSILGLGALNIQRIAPAWLRLTSVRTKKSSRAFGLGFGVVFIFVSPFTRYQLQES
jgi:hypothetical protein